MKKSFIILAALFAVSFAKAQITLEHTFNGDLYPWTYTLSGFTSAQLVYGDLFFSITQNYSTDDRLITIYDANSYEAVINLHTNSFGFVAARGYFSTSNEVMVLLEQNNHLVLLSESGELVQDLGEMTLNGNPPQIIRMSDGTCKLYVRSATYYMGEPTNVVTRIYSLPGNGVPTSVASPSSPTRSARKIACDGQVLIETESNTYTLTGQEIK